MIDQQLLVANGFVMMGKIRGCGQNLYSIDKLVKSGSTTIAGLSGIALLNHQRLASSGTNYDRHNWLLT